MYFIDIRKVNETADHVDYSFMSSEAVTPGVLRLLKGTGAVTLVTAIAGGEIGESPLGEWRAPERYFERASRQVALAWQRGELPESLVWAS